MAVKGYMVLDKLADNGVVLILNAVSLLLVERADKFVSLLGSEICIYGSEDGECLRAVECLVVTAGLDNPCEVGQIVLA